MKCLKCKSEAVYKVGMIGNLYVWECASCGCKYLCSESGDVVLYQNVDEKFAWHPIY